MQVRLIVDNLGSFSRIEPAIDIASEHQKIDGVTVISWRSACDVIPADLVIEAFAVNLPEQYIAAMATKLNPPVWINLEYLSAEAWVSEHHLLPSPHSKLSLTKYFFFPGFKRDTGGIIRERTLLAERDAVIFSNQTKRLHVFLFAYQNAATENLLRAIAEAGVGENLRCTVPEGTLAANLKLGGRIFDDMANASAIDVIPFITQQAFDLLLWRHDVLFVRGEDSFVRAQWAAKPFVWQIYPQKDDAHWVKLNAFLDLYCDGLDDQAALAIREIWRAWNAEDHANIGAAWRQFMVYLPALQTHAISWSKKLAGMPDLAANLLSFYQKTTKI